MLEGELAGLVSRLPEVAPADRLVLNEAGLALGIHWPAEYVALMSSRNGGNGWIGAWFVQLWPADELAETNRAMQTDDEFYPGLVLFGSDGGGEALAFDKETGDVLLVPFIGGLDDRIFLGHTMTEAFRRFERDDVFEPR